MLCTNHSSIELKCFIFNWIIYHDFHLYFFDIIILYRSKSRKLFTSRFTKKKNNSKLLAPYYYISATSHITCYIYIAENYLITPSCYFPPKWFCIFASVKETNWRNNKRELLYYHSGCLIYLYMKLFYKYFDFFYSSYTH